MLRVFLGRKGRGYGALAFGFLLLGVAVFLHARLMETFPSLFLLLLLGGIAMLFFGVMFLFFEERILAQRVKAQERLLEFLMEYIPDHLYFKDRQSRFIGGSKSLARYFGLERVEDLLGKTDFDFFSPPHAQEAYADEQRIMETGEPIVGKVELETWPDGRTSWVLTTKIPLRNEKGEITGIVGISKDITELKAKEEALERERQFLNDVFESIQDGLSLRCSGSFLGGKDGGTGHWLLDSSFLALPCSSTQGLWKLSHLSSSCSFLGESPCSFLGLCSSFSRNASLPKG